MQIYEFTSQAIFLKNNERKRNKKWYMSRFPWVINRLNMFSFRKKTSEKGNYSFKNLLSISSQNRSFSNANITILINWPRFKNIVLCSSLSILSISEKIFFGQLVNFFNSSKIYIGSRLEWVRVNLFLVHPLRVRWEVETTKFYRYISVNFFFSGVDIFQ